MIGWPPAAAKDVVQVDAPATIGRPVHPAMAAAPSLKVTVPVGGGPTPVTFATKVTDWPVTEGLTDDEDIVVADTTRNGLIVELGFALDASEVGGIEVGGTEAGPAD